MHRFKMCKLKGFFIGQEVLCIEVKFFTCFVLANELCQVVFGDFLWTGIAVLTDEVSKSTDCSLNISLSVIMACKF